MTMSTDIRDHNGVSIGYITKYRDWEGPLIYGDVPVLVTKDSPAKLRIFGAISSRESPMRSKSSHRKPSFQAVGAINGAQAYEPHGASAGAVHWISKNGNLQRLLSDLCQAIPDFAHEFAYQYTIDTDFNLRFAETDEVLKVEDYRSTEFCVFLHEVLGAHGIADEDEELANEVREKIAAVQCASAWKLIQDRDVLLKKHGFYEATIADERLRLITASMSINCGIALMERMLSKSDEPTAEALTESRILEYQRIGAGFGKDRSIWEMKTDLVYDRKEFTE